MSEDLKEVEKKSAKKAKKAKPAKKVKKSKKAEKPVTGIRKGKANLEGKFGKGRTPARMLGRVSDSNWNKYHKAAKSQGKTFSAWARDILDQAIAG